MKNAQDLPLGTRFVSFQIDRVIGRGGIGVVYQVTYRGKPYALKVIPGAKWVQTDEDIEELMVEGQALTWMKHANIVDVHETGVTSDKDIWIRMELLEGETLRDRIHRTGRLSVPMACTVVAMISRGLHQAHLRGIVHRDVKPENMFLTARGVAKLLDFGIIKLFGGTETKDGYRKGTPLYMAPEQIRGWRVMPAADVYSLGIAGYELLWRHPFVKNLRRYDLDALFHAHLHEVPRFPEELGIPEEVAGVLAKAVEKLPERRYQSALEFGTALFEACVRAQQQDPSIDTRPHEPPAPELMLTPGDGVRFGTGPVTGSAAHGNVSVDGAPAATGTGTGTGTGKVRAEVSVDAELAPPAYAKTEELPGFTEAPRADTVPLPAALRDPTCIQAAKEGRRPLPAEDAPGSGWAPVQTTIRLPRDLLKASPWPASAEALGAREEPETVPPRRSRAVARWFTVGVSSAVAGILAGTLWMYVSPVPPGIRAPAAEANAVPSAPAEPNTVPSAPAEEVESRRLKVKSSAGAPGADGEASPGASSVPAVASVAPAAPPARPIASTLVARSIAAAPAEEAVPAAPARPGGFVPKPPAAPRKARFLLPKPKEPPKKPAPLPIPSILQ